ncbi:MAG: FAD-dependent oxidoreductase [Oscillospiraceae bacterium]|jgi:NAD(P)H-nitrite reductase large subunit|nr:FAD-dependent oxidoreductase [Oscillospiraceae bacterium]
MNYVMIGNSTAAVGCIEGIRSIDPKGTITMISEEPYPAYSRPLISYLLQGKTTEEKMKARPAEFYEKNGVTLLCGKRAAQVDFGRKAVVLEDGEQIYYDRLFIATGARPFVPPMEGLERVKQKFTFMKLDDAKALEAALTPNSRVLIIGAGLIGLKCAEGISGRAGSITVVDLADRVLPSILDPKGSDMVRRHVESNGIRFLLGDSAAEFQPNRARLKSGRTVDFDLLVLAVGVRPNTELAAQAGCKVGRGIVIDEHSATSVPEIYAAGDCCECRDITTGQNRVLAILPNAYLQGETAGVNMAGGEKSFANAVPMNAIGFFGLHVLTAGSYDGKELVETKAGVYRKLVVRDNLLKGFILVGEIARAGIYTSLIRERTPLDTVDFELLKQKPQLMAFSARSRAVKLGGAK